MRAEGAVTGAYGMPIGKPVLRTNDLGEAQRVVSEVYVPHRLRGPARMSARLDLVDSARLTFGFLAYGAEVQLDVPPMESCYHVNLTLSGHTTVRQGGVTTETRAGRIGVVLSPTHPSRLRWSPDAGQFAVKVPVATLREQLSALLHDAVDVLPGFDAALDLVGRGAGILPAARFLAHQFSIDAQLDDLVRRQTESYLLTQLLLGSRHTYSARLSSCTTVGRQAFEEAIDYIEAYPDKVLGLVELATVAGTTGTALQAAFEHQLGLTVEEYVRGVRLTRVRVDLRSRAGAVHDMPALASKWGFRGTADLRAAYRRQYGEEIDDVHPQPNVNGSRVPPVSSTQTDLFSV